MAEVTFNPGDGFKYTVLETMHQKFYRCRREDHAADSEGETKDYFFTLDYKPVEKVAVDAYPFISGEAIRGPFTPRSESENE